MSHKHHHNKLTLDQERTADAGAWACLIPPNPAPADDVGPEEAAEDQETATSDLGA